MGVRTEQIASTLQRQVQLVISRGLHDPRVRGLVSVTGVRVAPDFSEAYIDVSVLPASHAALTMHGLRHAAARIRAEVSRLVAMRRVPRLVFRLDESMKQQAEIEAAVDSTRVGDDHPDAEPPREGDAA